MNRSHKERLWLTSFFAAIIATIIFSVYITEYQYGGDYYYMKIDTQPTISNVAVPVGISIQGYTYQGTAKNAQGKTKHLKLKTDDHDIGPFKSGQIIKITVNKTYGIVDYQRVTKKETPLRAQ
ncbi:YxeA family protein [Lacticaseibacillus paracasei]|uniref:YxeA family protein n=1 Tax=Lacticaseibacillus paracasei NRIC 0644 TaxID=1435038 RepID=A0A0C9PVQ6_LACPA|nr:YxeA family protein [Lacticaseibacillus paracasei]GAN36114.1 uncharacterized protein LC0644_0703 [Lacticaseibacillus paracasei NRIC 0644]